LSASDDAKAAEEQRLVCATLLESLRRANRALARHHNAALYRSLATVLETDGFYLEREPCLVCCDPEAPFASASLPELTAENKYTASTHVVRLRQCVELRKVSVSLASVRRTRLVKSISVYYCTKEVADVNE
jgi:E3 ubiquitin-protein ligase UBR4